MHEKKKKKVKRIKIKIKRLIKLFTPEDHKNDQEKVGERGGDAYNPNRVKCGGRPEVQ